MTKTLEKLNAYQLANLAEVATPDTPESAGAQMLLQVQDAVLEMIAYEVENNGAETGDELRDQVGDAIDGIAPNIYTFTKWQQFIDLAAWEEDLSEWGDPDVAPGASPSLDRLSDLALWQIGDRLALRLIEAWEEATNV